MKNKKIAILFIVLPVILIALLPAYNFYQYAKKYNYKKLFNTDSIEKYVNYSVYKIFNKSLVQDSVIAGKDGFLFLGNAYNNVLHKTNGTYRPSKYDIDSWTSRLKDVQNWYEKRGIKFVIAIAPNKHTIYKEKLPNWMSYDGKTLTDDIVKFAKEKDINMLDLRTALRKEKKKNQIYFKTDTHWNQIGAALAYEETISYLNNKYKINIPKPKYKMSQESRVPGDLALFLKISPLLGNKYEKRFNYIFDKKSDICKGNIDKYNLKLKPCIKTNNPIILINNQPQYTVNRSIKKHKLLFVCDSFATQASQLYNSSFNAIFKMYYPMVRRQDFSKFIDNHKPDIVIYQIVERMFYNNTILSLW